MAIKNLRWRLVVIEKFIGKRAQQPWSDCRPRLAEKKETKKMGKESSGLFKITNKFADRARWPSALEEGKQGKHIKGHPNYAEGKSVLTISMREAGDLALKFSGRGDVVGNEASSNKERVDFGKVIGFLSDANGKKIPTTMGLIHHSKKGTHIVPCNPKEE